MNTKNKYWINDFSLENVRNRQEVRVVELMRKVLPGRKGFCGCRLCLEDVYAYTLSNLPAHYTQTGSLVVRSAQPPDAEVLELLHQAFDRITETPSHSTGTAKPGA